MGLSRKSLCSTCRGSCGHLRPIAWRGLRNERIQQPVRDGLHVIHGLVEGFLVGFGRFRETGKLAHELNGGRSDLLVGRGRIEVEQRTNVPAHGPILRQLRGRFQLWSYFEERVTMSSLGVLVLPSFSTVMAVTSARCPSDIRI